MWVDLHNHVVPDVDDGARDVEQARAAVAALAAAGVEAAVATPHLDASLTHEPDALERRLAVLDAGWARLQDAADGAVPLFRGAEVKLDVPEVKLDDPRLRLGGGKTVLVEFPFMTVPPRSPEVLRAIVDAGYQPLLAHPERYEGAGDVTEAAGAWIEAGAALQVNAGALVGRYGSRAMARSRALVGRGLAHCLASDYHGAGDPGLREARALLIEWGGEEQARLLFDVNPERLLNGERPLPVPPLAPRRSLWRRLIDASFHGREA